MIPLIERVSTAKLALSAKGFQTRDFEDRVEGTKDGRTVHVSLADAPIWSDRMVATDAILAMVGDAKQDDHKWRPLLKHRVLLAYQADPEGLNHVREVVVSEVSPNLLYVKFTGADGHTFWSGVDTYSVKDDFGPAPETRKPVLR